MHRLLERQLRRCFGSVDSAPKEIKGLLKAVDEAYQQADVDRMLLERSMDLTSEELLERNRELGQQVEAEKTRTAMLERQSQTLLDVVQAVARGNLDVEIEQPDEGDQVLSDLAAGIGTMVSDLREMLSGQERARVQLEEARVQLEAALEEAMLTQQRYLEQEWGTYSTAAQVGRGYAITQDAEGPSPDAWMPAMTSAVQQEQTVLGDEEQQPSLAIPIQLHGETIGVLGFRHDGALSLGESEIGVVQTIVEQVGLALESQRLFEQAQTALQEMEATQQRYLSRVWGEYMRSRDITGFVKAGDRVASIGAEALPEVQQAMSEQRTLILDDGAESPLLMVPIVLRGQPIGALGFRTEEKGQEWGSVDVALAEAISEQLALAAENLRLLDETQRRAARERLTVEITNKMRRAASVDDIVQAAVDELFSATRTSRAFARLGVKQDGEEDGA